MSSPTHIHTADYPRTKRGRYSDPGPRGREGETTAEQKLESLITRVGEKVCIASIAYVSNVELRRASWSRTIQLFACLQML